MERYYTYRQEALDSMSFYTNGFKNLCPEWNHFHFCRCKVLTEAEAVTILILQKHMRHACKQFLQRFSAGGNPPGSHKQALSGSAASPPFQCLTLDSVSGTVSCVLFNSLSLVSSFFSSASV